MTDSKSQATNATTDLHLKHFRRFEMQDGQPNWLLPIRKAGMARFNEIGLPTQKHEDWRFTNTTPNTNRPFAPVFEFVTTVTAADLQDFAFAKQAGPRLVFVNGHFAPKLSSITNQPAGVRVVLRSRCTAT